MKSVLSTVFLGALLALGSAAIAAAPAADTVVGTWNLNLAKSKFNPGPGPKSQTRTYSESAQGLSLATKSVGADGKETTGQTTYKFDGKDYPVTGSPDFDTLTAKKVDNFTTEFTLKRAGKVVATGSRTVSNDGKVLTNPTKGTDAKGAQYDNLLIFDRQ